MDAVEVIEDAIKNHPLIDFDYEVEGQGVHWCLCPCGYSTKRYRSARAAQKSFKAHIVDEVNEALVEQLFLGAPAPAPAGLPTAPARALARQS